MLYFVCIRHLSKRSHYFFMKIYIKHEFLNVITNGVIAGNAVAFLDLDITVYVINVLNDAHP